MGSFLYNGRLSCESTHKSPLVVIVHYYCTPDFNFLKTMKFMNIKDLVGTRSFELLGKSIIIRNCKESACRQ